MWKLFLSAFLPHQRDLRVTLTFWYSSSLNNHRIILFLYYHLDISLRFFFFKACFLSFPTRKRSLGTAYALPVLRYCCSPGLSDGLRPTLHGSSSCLSKGQGRIPGCVARAVSHGAAFKGILCLVYCSSLAVPEFIIIRTGGPTVSFLTGPRLSPWSFCDLPTHVAPKAKLCRPDRGAYAHVTSHASFSFNTHLQISKSYLLCP